MVSFGHFVCVSNYPDGGGLLIISIIGLSGLDVIIYRCLDINRILLLERHLEVGVLSKDKKMD